MTTEPNPVTPENTQDIDDLKGITAFSDGEIINNPNKPVEVKETEEEAPKDTEPKDEKPKRPGKVERENARLRAELDSINARLAKLDQPVDKSKTEPDGPPKIEDFEDVLDFQDAKTAYAIEQAKKSLKEEQTQELTKAQHAAQMAVKVQAFNEREAAIIESDPEYTENLAELVSDGLMTEPMIEVIMDSDIGEKISHYLTKNPEEAAAIARLQGPQLYRVMGMLEASLGQKSEKVETRQTKTPSPITPVKVAANTADIDPTKGFKDFEKWFNKGK